MKLRTSTSPPRLAIGESEFKDSNGKIGAGANTVTTAAGGRTTAINDIVGTLTNQGNGTA